MHEIEHAFLIIPRFLFVGLFRVQYRGQILAQNPITLNVSTNPAAPSIVDVFNTTQRSIGLWWVIDGSAQSVNFRVKTSDGSTFMKQHKITARNFTFEEVIPGECKFFDFAYLWLKFRSTVTKWPCSKLNRNYQGTYENVVFILKYFYGWDLVSSSIVFQATHLKCFRRATSKAVQVSVFLNQSTLTRWNATLPLLLATLQIWLWAFQLVPALDRHT